MAEYTSYSYTTEAMIVAERRALDVRPVAFLLASNSNRYPLHARRLKHAESHTGTDVVALDFGLEPQPDNCEQLGGAAHDGLGSSRDSRPTCCVPAAAPSCLLPSHAGKQHEQPTFNPMPFQ
jgi:hypothetical protein